MCYQDKNKKHLKKDGRIMLRKAENIERILKSVDKSKAIVSGGPEFRAIQLNRKLKAFFT